MVSLEQSVGKALHGETAIGRLVPSVNIRRIASRSHRKPLRYCKHSLPSDSGFRALKQRKNAVWSGSTEVHHLGLWRFYESRRFVLQLTSRRSLLSAPSLAIDPVGELARDFHAEFETADELKHLITRRAVSV